MFWSLRPVQCVLIKQIVLFINSVRVFIHRVLLCYMYVQEKQNDDDCFKRIEHSWDHLLQLLLEELWMTAAMLEDVFLWRHNESVQFSTSLSVLHVVTHTNAPPIGGRVVSHLLDLWLQGLSWCVYILAVNPGVRLHETKFADCLIDLFGFDLFVYTGA